MTSVLSQWPDSLKSHWPSTTQDDGISSYLPSSGRASTTAAAALVQSGIASISDAWVKYWQPVQTDAPGTGVNVSTRNSAGGTFSLIDSVPKRLNRPRRLVPSHATSTAISRRSGRYHTPPNTNRTKSQTQLESLRTRQGDAWSMQAVRTAFDIVEEMCASNMDGSNMNSSSSVLNKMIASLDLPLQIAAMESYQKDRRPYRPRKKFSKMSRTDVEDYFMSGALPAETDSFGTKRRGGYISLSAISDVEEDYVRTKKLNARRRRQRTDF
jgi:hypothetical protein